MLDKTLDPVTWYSNRELDFTPLHFTLSNTPLTIESKLWILNNLRGRFSVANGIVTTISSYSLLEHSSSLPAFEDPKEAMLYELTWS